MPVKAVFVLDNVPTYLEQELLSESAEHVKIYYLPAHMTSLLSDQGVVASLMWCYWHKLLSEILSKFDGMSVTTQSLNTINIKDMIYTFAKASEEMPDTTFVKSWKNTLARGNRCY